MTDSSTLNTRFIAFEGGDGAGKTTQIALLADRLRSAGQQVVVTREPGGSELGKQIRQILLFGAEIGHRTEALLFAADRAEHVREVVVPALESGSWVLTDRFMDSSVAYQSAGRGLDAAEVTALSMWAVDGLVPSCTVVLDAPVDRLAERLGSKKDRMESAGDDFHAKVRSCFLRLAAADPSRYAVVYAARARQTVHADIVRSVFAITGFAGLRPASSR